jgi:hypothetical protein
LTLRWLLSWLCSLAAVLLLPVPRPVMVTLSLVLVLVLTLRLDVLVIRCSGLLMGRWMSLPG